MSGSHLLYINKGENIVNLVNAQSTSGRLGYPRPSISQDALSSSAPVMVESGICKSVSVRNIGGDDDEDI